MRFLNRRGDTPTLLLFVFAFVFCVAALLAMVSFAGNQQQELDHVPELLADVAFEEASLLGMLKRYGADAVLVGQGDVVVVRHELTRAFQKRRDGMTGVVLEDTAEVLDDLAAGGFTVTAQGSEMVLKTDVLAVSAVVEDHEIHRAFAYELVFRSDGSVKLVERIA